MTAPELSAAERAKVERFGLHSDEEVAKVGADAEYVRSRLAPSPTEGIQKSPDEMIDDLEWTKYGTGRIALVLKEADLIRRRARRAFEAEHAKALLASDGKSSEQREAEALLVCAEERLALDEAEVAYDFARGVARSIEQTGSMTQTQASLVKAQLSLAGTGRES